MTRFLKHRGRAWIPAAAVIAAARSSQWPRRIASARFGGSSAEVDRRHRPAVRVRPVDDLSDPRRDRELSG